MKNKQDFLVSRGCKLKIIFKGMIDVEYAPSRLVEDLVYNKVHGGKA
jgi:hypothetical protein